MRLLDSAMCVSFFKNSLHVCAFISTDFIKLRVSKVRRWLSSLKGQTVAQRPSLPVHVVQVTDSRQRSRDIISCRGSNRRSSQQFYANFNDLQRQHQQQIEFYYAHPNYRIYSVWSQSSINFFVEFTTFIFWIMKRFHYCVAGKIIFVSNVSILVKLILFT